MNFLPVTGGVCCDLGGLRPVVAGFLQMLAYLLAARTRGIKVFLRVAFDFRCAATSRLDFIAEIPQTIGQFRLIHGSRELLAVEKSLLLEGAGLPSLRSVTLKMTA